MTAQPPLSPPRWVSKLNCNVGSKRWYKTAKLQWKRIVREKS